MDGESGGSQEKKLTDAARYWARGSENYQDAIDDLERMRAPPEAIEELRAMQACEDFEVFPENWEAVMMFMRVQTQWRATYGQYYGLDYNVLFKVFDLYQVSDQKECLDNLRVIEAGVLAALSEER